MIIQGPKRKITVPSQAAEASSTLISVRSPIERPRDADRLASLTVGDGSPGKNTTENKDK